MTSAPAKSDDRLSSLIERHRAVLDNALEATHDRRYWSAFAELPKAYGDDGPANGRSAFEALRGEPFPLDQPAVDQEVGNERSPYGFDLAITYPHSPTESLIAAAKDALPAWRDSSPDGRASVCMEIVTQLNNRSHELAQAVMHTTGQAFLMAFQAGGPHAQDRALEAIAYAYEETTRHALSAHWEKPQGGRPPLRLSKRFRIRPRGIGVVIGCNTFPTWNGYPGLFASLVTGNPVIVKPSRRSILPLALTVLIARDVLGEAGFDPNIVTLAVDAPGERRGAELAVHPDVKIIDYTGSPAFGGWLEENARQAVVFAEKSGVNSVVVNSTDDYRGMLENLAFTLSLYSGQMCTTTQNLIVPNTGIATNEGLKTSDEFETELSEAIADLLSESSRATAILGAIANDDILARLSDSKTLGPVLLASREVEHPEWPEAIVRTPTLIAASGHEGPHMQEQFGPISFVVRVDDTAAALTLLAETTSRCGAITGAVYSTDAVVLEQAERVALEAGVHLSENLTGGIYVNQTAAFSDFHASAANPAANASLTDGAFVTSRFQVIQTRRPLPAEAAAAAD